MAHPYAKFSQNKVSHDRAKSFVPHRAGGGEVENTQAGSFVKSGGQRTFFPRMGKQSIEGGGVRTYDRELGRNPKTGAFGGKAGKERLLGSDVPESEMPKYAKGGRTKGKKPHVKIDINTAPSQGPGGLPPPLPAAALANGAPRPAPSMLPPGGAPPSPMMPPMKRGGPVKKAGGGPVKMTGGAEGGVGRLQKARNAKAARGGK